MKAILAVIACVGLSPLVSFGRDFHIGETVYPREGTQARVDGAIVDLKTIPQFSFQPEVGKIDGDWLWLEKGWVRKKDVMRAREAVEYYTEQVRLKPTQASLWRILGSAWKHSGVSEQNEHALKNFTEAIRLDPNDAQTFVARGSVWANRYSNEGSNNSIKDFSEAIRLAPNDATAYHLRGKIWSRIGEIDKEIRDQTEAIRLDPSNAEYREHRGLIYKGIGDLDHFLADYSEVARLCDVGTANHEDYRSAFKSLAWFRATWPDDRYRDGKQAVEYATKACEASAKEWKLRNFKEWEYLATLAAAYAANGDFANAIKWSDKSFDAGKDLEWVGDDEKARIAELRELYETKKAYRDPEGYNDIARLKASCRHDRYRDGKTAVELATKACEMTAWKNWKYIDTLAAACAETGDFVKAIQWEQKAIELAPAMEKKEATERLELYRANKPFRELHPEQMKTDE